MSDFMKRNGLLAKFEELARKKGIQQATADVVANETTEVVESPKPSKKDKKSWLSQDDSDMTVVEND